MSKSDYLIPKHKFDEYLEQIEALAEIYFDEFLKKKVIDEDLKREILYLIEVIDKDVFASLSTAYNDLTIERITYNYSDL